MPPWQIRQNKKLRASLLILEQQLTRISFFGGHQWGMADFMVACVLYTLTRLNFDFTAYPKLGPLLLASINRPEAQSARKLRKP